VASRKNHPIARRYERQSNRKIVLFRATGTPGLRAQPFLISVYMSPMLSSNVISSSPPTRPFHWGLIKCTLGMSEEETRAGRPPTSRTERGGKWRARLKGSRSSIIRRMHNSVN